MSLVLAGVYRVPGLAHAYTVEGFCLLLNLQKMRVHGCEHTIHVILNVGTVQASIKF